MKNRFSEIQNYDELLEKIKNWTSFKDEHIYDFGGMVHILVACIDNLMKYSNESDLENIEEFFTNEQIQFLKKLLNHIKE